jgi:mobilome CxxCx(11)CxxC protein
MDQEEPKQDLSSASNNQALPRATPRNEDIAIDCYERAVDACGTGDLFRRRSIDSLRLIRLVTFFGIAVPVFGFLLLAALGLNWQYASTMMVGMGVFLAIQAVFSVLITVWNVPDSFQYSSESSTDNAWLASKFVDLAKSILNPSPDIEIRYMELKTLDDKRRDMDGKRGLSEKEIRRAHRFGLRQYKRKCSACNIAPTSMKSTSCGVCGDYSLWKTK